MFPLHTSHSDEIPCRVTEKEGKWRPGNLPQPLHPLHWSWACEKLMHHLHVMHSTKSSALHTNMWTPIEPALQPVMVLNSQV